MDSKWQRVWCVVGLGGMLLAGGCRPGSSASTVTLPDTGKTVSAHGLTLDAAADPKAVAWALLMNLRDDLLAPPGDERRAAFLATCELAHIADLRKRLLNDEAVIRYLRGWAPKINYYIDAIDTDFATAKTRMTSRQLPEQQVVVQYVAPGNDDAPDRAGQLPVAISIGLTRTGQGPWRAIEVGFGPSPSLQLNPPSAGP